MLRTNTRFANSKVLCGLSVYRSILVAWMDSNYTMGFAQDISRVFKQAPNSIFDSRLASQISDCQVTILRPLLSFVRALVLFLSWDSLKSVTAEEWRAVAKETNRTPACSLAADIPNMTSFTRTSSRHTYRMEHSQTLHCILTYRLNGSIRTA